MVYKKIDSKMYRMSIVGVVLFFAVFLFIFWKYTETQILQDLSLYSSSYDVQQNSVPPIISTVAIQFDFGDEKKRRFVGNVGEGATLRDALQIISQVGKMTIQWSKNEIVGIDGVRDAAKHWVVYKNGTKLSPKVADIMVIGKDEIRIKYE